MLNSDCAQAYHKCTGKKPLLPLRQEPLNIFWRTTSTQASEDSPSSAGAAGEFLHCFHCADEVYRFPTSHASLLTLLMCILVDAKRCTHKKYRMAFQRFGFSYKRVALHRIKTKTDIYNSISGILCCLYKFPLLIRLYGIHPMYLPVFFLFFYTLLTVLKFNNWQLMQSFLSALNTSCKSPVVKASKQLFLLMSIWRVLH